MLEEFSLCLPNKVYSGRKALQKIKDIIRCENSKKVAVFTDKGIRAAGVFDLAFKYILEAGVKYVILDDLPTEPTYFDVQKLIDECNSHNVDFIIAIGGGSVIDTAKLASLLVGGGEVKKLLKDSCSATKKIKTLMIPTTAGTGAEATVNAIVAVPEEQLKVGIVNQEMMSDYVILDADVIKNLPSRIASATGVDALCHAIECYTSNKANPFSDMFALEAFSMIINNIEKAVLDPNAIEEKEQMQIASFYAGIAITSSGTTAVHALSYPLGGKYHIAHGISNAILLMPVMRFNENACRERLATIYDKCFSYCENLSKEEKSKAVVARMEEVVGNLSIPKTLNEFGVSIGDLDDLVEAGMKVTRLLNNNMRLVTAEDARRIYKEVLK